MRRRGDLPAGEVEPKVVAGVTDEDPMTSRRITRQPKKQRTARVVAKVKRGLGRAASRKR